MHHGQLLHNLQECKPCRHQRVIQSYPVQVGQGLNRLTTIEPAHTIVQTVMNEAIMSIRKAQRLIEIV